MPELPEVETIVRELRGTVLGRNLAGVQVFRDNALQGVSPAAFAASLRGRRITGVERRGKFILVQLEPAAVLIVHLRMTGKLVLSPPLTQAAPHHRVWFCLEGGDVLVFQDLRCFGTLSVLPDAANSPSLQKLGQEPTARGFTTAWLRGALASSSMPLKHWLMDQRKIAGLGNIYVAEILFAAELSPTLPARDVTQAQAKRLHAATKDILRRAIRKNGTTISDFRRVDDKTGEFQNFLRVYGREGAPCHRCRTPIQRIVQQQRSTFYCPTCQS